MRLARIPTAVRIGTCRVLHSWRASAASQALQSAQDKIAGQKGPYRAAVASVGAKVVVLTGPTAVGKTHLSLALAAALDGEIISADSVQVYRGLDVGSDKVGTWSAICCRL